MGRYLGDHDANTSTTTYYAIPYAYASRSDVAKPIHTKPGISSDRSIDASQHGPSCINFDLPPPFDAGFSFLLGGEPIKPQSENCLNLDVYVPDGDHKDLPVFVFTPGGGFTVGASFAYDVRPLVQRSVEMGKPFIGVVLNYRLGPLGFLNPSTWGKDTNLGLLDQVEALRWIKKHISRFGGCPDKVTISGQSAGGESTLHQFLWTKEDLFRSAWMMSVPSSGIPFLSTEPVYNDDLVRSYARACGCPKRERLEEAVECLRTTDIDTLTAQSAAWEGRQTTLSGSFIRDNVFDAIRAGKFPKVPVVVSMTRDDGSVQAAGFRPNNTETTSLLIQGLSAARGLKGRRAAQFLQEMLQAYPNDPALGSPFDGRDTNYGVGRQYKRMAAITTDTTYTEAWLEYLEAFSKRTKTWGLLWEQAIQGTPPEYGVIHGSDLNYFFPTLFGQEADPRTLGHGDLVAAAQGALINFIHDGDPNGCSGGSDRDHGYRWPLYSESKQVTVMNASHIAVSVPPPHRPGFDVIHKFLRPGPF
ncbi:hypothetical protein LTR37_011071 [Vermiconidia calcicola]|uniref:Uncharacterized protein n=1 Tax=Vermiconidia calcicola TaxID=1690605 RepID=A0ACC3N333_9PEZI|nr:hypothetical protein LTR37_011071 [Vermiconidia calcicola]